jgi:hypothetical protein
MDDHLKQKEIEQARHEEQIQRLEE